MRNHSARDDRDSRMLTSPSSKYDSHIRLCRSLTKPYKSHCYSTSVVPILPHSVMRFSLSLLFTGFLAGVSASNVLDLGSDNFDSVIGKGKPGLVEL